MKKLSVSPMGERYADPAVAAAKAGLLPSWSPLWRALTPWEWVDQSGDSSPSTQNGPPAAVWSQKPTHKVRRPTVLWSRDGSFKGK